MLNALKSFKFTLKTLGNRCNIFNHTANIDCLVDNLKKRVVMMVYNLFRVINTGYDKSNILLLGTVTNLQ